MTKPILSADIGSGFTKATVSLNEADLISFQSLVTGRPKESIFGLEQSDGVFFDGKSFLTGSNAKHFGDPSDRLDTINDEWHGTDKWLALLYQAISQTFDEDVKEINLITGLPQKIYSLKNEELKTQLTRQHEFSVDGVDYDVNIKAFVMPQAAGALIYSSYEDESLLEEEVGVLDFGTNTTGLSVLDAGDFVGRKSDGISVGANELYKAVALHLKSEHGYIPDTADLPKIVRAKAFRFQRENIDITKIVDDSAKLVFQDVMILVNEIWKNKATDIRVFVTGGAGDLFYEAVVDSIPHAERAGFSTDENEPSAEGKGSAFYDVAKGMFTYLDARLGE